MPDQTAKQKALARAVRELRVRVGMTQEGLSDAAGLGPNYVSQVERGMHRTSFDAVTRIADGLGITLGELIRVYEERLGQL